MKWAKSALLPLGLIFGIATALLGVVTTHYLYVDYKSFSFLASDPTIDEVMVKLGKPDEVYTPDSQIVQKGWPLPKNKRSFEVWVYSSKTGRNFFVYIDRENNRIEYVFSSSS